MEDIRGLTEKQWRYLEEDLGPLKIRDRQDIEEWRERIGEKEWNSFFGAATQHWREHKDQHPQIVGPSPDDEEISRHGLPEILEGVADLDGATLGFFKTKEIDYAGSLIDGPSLCQDIESKYGEPNPDLEYVKAIACLDDPYRLLCMGYKEQIITVVRLTGSDKGNWQRTLPNRGELAETYNMLFKPFGKTVTPGYLSQAFTGKLDRWFRDLAPEGILWKAYVLGKTEPDIFTELFWLANGNPNIIILPSGVHYSFDMSIGLSRPIIPAHEPIEVIQLLSDDPEKPDWGGSLYRDTSESKEYKRFISERWALQRRFINRICREYVCRHRDNREPHNSVTAEEIADARGQWQKQYVACGLAMKNPEDRDQRSFSMFDGVMLDGYGGDMHVMQAALLLGYNQENGRFPLP